MLTVLDEFGAYPAVVARELDRYLPFLATTAVLIAVEPIARPPYASAWFVEVTRTVAVFRVVDASQPLLQVRPQP